MKQLLKIFFLLFFFSITCFNTRAQQKHFIYIESEDKQPFAVVLDGKVYSSSDYGYVILPRLTDGDYKFTVSFPMNKYPDQSFKCVINKKDIGYTLKNIEDKGWALMNMQTQKALMANGNDVAVNNAFGDMLSEVVSDSNLTKNITVIAETPVDSANNSIRMDTVAGNADVINTDVGFITDSLSQLQKISESRVDTGTQMVFVDKTENGADTISVFVPTTDSLNNIPSANSGANITQQQTEGASSQTNNNMLKTDTVATVNNEISSEMPDTSVHVISNPFYKPGDENVSSGVNANNKVDTPLNDQTIIKPRVTNGIKEDCRSSVTDNDLDKLKRKMFVQNNSNDMIQTAVKYLSNKCLTTDQVKMLGNLFSSDDGRYNLYDALYDNVYDYGNYPLLESQILDPYYKKRFGAMLR